ncbi:MAG: hypothetical protein ACKPHU_23800, partial [Planctomycetaceae bacterium]
NRLLTGGGDARINTWLLPALNAPDSSAGTAEAAAERLKIWWGVQLENPIGQAHEGRISAICTGPAGRLISADSTGRLILWPGPPFPVQGTCLVITGLQEPTDLS